MADEFNCGSWKCLDCGIWLYSRQVHDRWHQRQAAKKLTKWGMENQADA